MSGSYRKQFTDNLFIFSFSPWILTNSEWWSRIMICVAPYEMGLCRFLRNGSLLLPMQWVFAASYKMAIELIMPAQKHLILALWLNCITFINKNTSNLKWINNWNYSLKKKYVCRNYTESWREIYGKSLRFDLRFYWNGYSSYELTKRRKLIPTILRIPLRKILIIMMIELYSFSRYSINKVLSDGNHV